MAVLPPFLELAYYVVDSDRTRAVRVLIPDWRESCTKAERPGVVGLPSARGEESEIYENGILVLRTEGEQFSGVIRAENRDLRQLGEIVANRFLVVADALPCVYGAILIEYSLETPDELRTGGPSLAFRNFFLSTVHLPRVIVQEAVREAGPDSFVQSTRTCVYISMNAEFNPAARDVETAEAQSRSARIARTVATALARLR